MMRFQEENGCSTTQIWIVIKQQSLNLVLKDWFLAWNECEILTHSQQQPQVPNAHKKKPTIRLTTRVTMLCPPPSLQALALS